MQSKECGWLMVVVQLHYRRGTVIKIPSHFPSPPSGDVLPWRRGSGQTWADLLVFVLYMDKMAERERQRNTNRGI